MDRSSVDNEAHERLTCLQRIVLALSAAHTVENVAEVILTEGLQALGGNAGSVALLTDDASEFVTVRCHGYPLDTSLPNADVVRTGQALFLETFQDRQDRYPHLARHRADTHGAQVALPLVVDGRNLGGLALSFPENRVFPATDRAFLQTIGQICAQALERARLYDAARREIEERRQAEKDLRDSEARKAAILAAALDCIVTIDEAGCVMDWNPAAEQTFGFSREQALGQDLATLIIPPSLRGAHTSGIAHYLATGEGPVLNKRIEVPAIRADGTEFPAELTAVPIHLEGRSLFTAYLRDLSDRKRAETELQLAVERQQTFLRDVLLSVTDGKLRLCQDVTDLPMPFQEQGASIPLTLASGLYGLRQEVRSSADEIGFTEERAIDLVTAVGEASMNVVVHVGEGSGQVFVDPDRQAVQVWIIDHGHGITMANLPRAAFEKGYTTAGTLGHGMKIMLQTADRIWLLTGPHGTTVVLEQDRIASRTGFSSWKVSPDSAKSV